MQKKYLFLLTILFFTPSCGEDQAPAPQKNTKQAVPNSVNIGQGIAPKPAPTNKITTTATKASPSKSDYKPTQKELYALKIANSGNLEALKAYIKDNRINPFVRDFNGNTLIISAVKANSPQMLLYIKELSRNNFETLLNLSNSKTDSPLHIAFQDNNIEMFKALLDLGADPNNSDAYRNYIIHLVAQKNSTPFIEALFKHSKHKIEAGKLNYYNETPLSYAMQAENIELAKKLISLGADINISDKAGDTFIDKQIKANNFKFIEMALQLGANINNLNLAKKTPLITAIEAKNWDITQKLLDLGADPNTYPKNKFSPLQMIVHQENAQYDIVVKLLQRGAKISDAKMSGGNAIYKAIQKGNARILKLMILNGADITQLETKNNNALLLAIKTKDDELAKTLVAKTKNLDKRNSLGIKSLTLAIANRMTQTALEMLKYGANPNDDLKKMSEKPVWQAIKTDNKIVLQELLNKNVEINKEILLMKAVLDKNTEVATLLLENNANPNIMNEEGKPLTWLAVEQNNIPLLNAILRTNVKLDVTDRVLSQTPLSLAVSMQNKNIVKLLLENKANPNTIDSNGATPLLYACFRANKDIAELLLNAGANPKAKDRRGFTVMDYAKNNNETDLGKKDEIINFLKSKGIN